MSPADRGRDGAPAKALTAVAGVWPESNVADVERRHIQRVLDAIGGLDSDAAPVAILPTSALAFAVIDKRGAMRGCDASFAALALGDVDVGPISRLLTRAKRRGTALGLAETASGAVIALCAASPLNARAWPLTEALRCTLDRAAEPMVLMAFAAERASQLAFEAVAMFGLSELEARIAVALLEAPTLDIAANRVGVGRETARDALAGAMRKMGVRRTPMLVRRLTDLIHDGTVSEEGEPLAEALDLTAGEARVTRLTADGATTADVAATLGVKPETVKSHLRSAFSKVGVSRAKDLGRLDVEMRTLRALSRAREVVPRPEQTDGKLRMIVQPDGRRVAFIDYGPPGGHLLLVCHALASGRTLPPNLAGPLRAAGFRPVVPQRPGFGLTDPPLGDYLPASADDMAAILTALKRGSADVLARDIATAAVLTFAEMHPRLLGRVVLLNPEPQLRTDKSRSYAIPAAARILQRHPELTATFFESLRRQTRTERLAALLLETFKAGAPSDIAGLRDPERLDWMVRDIQAMVACSVVGIVQERLVYAGGWSPPATVGGDRWTVACCVELGKREPEAWWNLLPNFRFEAIEEGGLLTPVTHPDTVLRLLVETDGR
jgi:DNA-binding CsgD family transcriptional regulator/pimeloyl-ACP methyl ester carboxylesterase